MSKVEITTPVTITATIKLDEAELRALDALVGYGTDSFLKVFYTHMGRAYLEPHEKGLIKLFANIRATTGRPLSDLDTVRQLLRQKRAEQAARYDETPKPARPWWKFWVKEA